MTTHNLNDNVNDSFEFELNANKYVMRYPTLEEIQKLQDIIKEYPDDDQKVMEFIYGYITGPEGADDISKTLPKQNIRVIQNFNKMIKLELGIAES